MELPIKNKTFVDTGITNRVQENFQHFLFKDLDFKKRKEPISFFRSDFRGVKIENVQFYNNNFDRADFINAYITNTTFEKCSFGTDFSNTIFYKVLFKSNLEDTCAYYNCSFVDCLFENENIINTTNRNSKYTGCNFSNCIFEKNSFDDIYYENTTFKEISFAEMGAYNLNFISCKFENTTVDPDYLGSYMIKESDIKELKYSYRGKGISLSGKIETDLKTLSLFYLQNNRFYEAFNAALLYSFYNKFENSIIEFFKTILHYILQDQHHLRRTEQLTRIIKIMIFYSDSGMIPSNDFLYIIGLLEKTIVPFESISDKILYNNNLQLLKETVFTNFIELGNWDVEFTKITYAEIEIDEDNYNDFKKCLKEYYRSIENEYAISDSKSGYQILGTRKGSLIIELVGYSIGLYCLATIAKSLISRGMEIRMEYCISQRTKKILLANNTKSMNEWEKKVTIARRIQKKPSDDILLKANPLVKLMKSFHIFPNAVFKDRNS